MNESVILSRAGSVATLTLNRPNAMNALDLSMAESLLEHSRVVRADASVRALVVTGAGSAFMAGGDIKWFHSMIQGSLETQSDDALIEHTINTIHGAIENFAGMEQPVIASVRGACAGFGLSLMAACDLALCADDALFSLAYIKIGTSPDGGSTYSLPRAIGSKRAMELALLGDRFGPGEALNMGLVNRVVPAAALDGDTQALANTLAGGPRRALGRTKALIRGSLGRTLSEQLAAERDAFVSGFSGPEFAEGVSAFVDKRRPQYLAD